MNRSICACAYHPQHKLTNFCRNQECLLPLCPRCVSIHVQDHNQNHSTAMIFTLNYMLEQVKITFQQAKAKALALGQALLRVQDLKKRNEIKARNTLQETMQKIRDQVQKQLNKIEQEFMEIINKHGQQTVMQLQQLDGLVQKQARNCQKNLDQVNSDLFLKALIVIQQTSHMDNLATDLQQISDRINELSKTTIQIPSNMFPLGSLRKSIRDVFGYKNHLQTASTTPSTSPIK